ncbi:polysialyltransferase family glycosyltransferase [Kosakonia sp. YIM B13605]|uniref:polysialyltransferase family glycosyltransferase n=1 Tax=Kosakonia TaxID=1330547 RepID=UPI0028AA24B2|nr:polysialyltransferase family glycosyltransferase [Kosakonia sacchari]
MIDVIYISGVLNESHLVYVASFINKIKNEGNFNFAIYYENNSRFLSSAKIHTSIIEKWLGKVNYVKPGKSIRAGYRKEILHLFIGSVGIKPVLLMRKSNITCKISNIVIDEGIGSASDIHTMQKVYMRERKINSFKAYLYAFIYFYLKRGVLAKQTWRLFDGLKPNQQIMDFIKAKSVPIKYDNTSYMLLLTQPWVKLGILTEDEYKDYISNIISEANALKLKLIVKPHPSEDFQLYENLGLNVIDTLTPVELCFDFDNCFAVIGFNSTSLILLNAIYNTPAFRLSFEKIDSVVSCSRLQESLFNKYTSQRMSIIDIFNELSISEH